MRPRGISQMVRVGVLSAAVLGVVWRAGPRVGSGVAEAQKNGNPKPPPTLQNGPTMLPPLEQPATVPEDLELFVDQALRQRIIEPEVLDVLLAFTAQDVAHELPRAVKLHQAPPADPGS